MLIKPFGGAFTFEYYPHVGGTAINPPSQTPSIYVFEHNPSVDDIDAGTDAVGSEITSWTETIDNVRSITIPNVSDPGGSDKYKNYWLGIKYIAVSGGTATYDVQLFRLQRPDGQTSDPTPTTLEVRAADEEMTTFFPTDAPITNAIRTTEAKLKAFYKSKSVLWTQIENPEELKNVIIYYTLMNLYLGKRREPEDFFDLKYQEYRALFEGSRDALVLEYDSNNDDHISAAEESRRVNRVIFRR